MAPAAAPARFALSPPVGDPAFPAAFAGTVDTIVTQGLDRAQILVTPPDMGPVHVELSLSGEKASVAFTATRPETRTAIEQSLPTLRAALSSHGIELAQTSVGQGDARHAGGFSGGRSGSAAFGPAVGLSRARERAAAVVAGAAPDATRMLDLFA